MVSQSPKFRFSTCSLHHSHFQSPEKRLAQARAEGSDLIFPLPNSESECRDWGDVPESGSYWPACYASAAASGSRARWPEDGGRTNLHGRGCAKLCVWQWGNAEPDECLLAVSLIGRECLKLWQGICCTGSTTKTILRHTHTHRQARMKETTAPHRPKGTPAWILDALYWTLSFFSRARCFLNHAWRHCRLKALKTRALTD